MYYWKLPGGGDLQDMPANGLHLVSSQSLGSHQNICRSLLLSSPSRIAQRFIAPHSGAHFGSPHQTLVAVSLCSGQTHSGPHHQGPNHFAFFEVYDLQGMEFESLILSLQLWSLNHSPVCTVAAWRVRKRGAILGSMGCNFCCSEKA